MSHVAEQWKTLAEALEATYNADRLKAYARVLGIKGPTRKAELARTLADAVLGTDLHEQQPERLWGQLDETQRAAVAEALHGGGVMLDKERFLAKYGVFPRWLRDPSECSFRDEPTLLGLFLVFDPSFARQPPSLPADLAMRLRRFVLPPRREELATHDAPFPPEDDIEIHTCETERAATEELFAVLRLVNEGRLQVSDKTHRPSARGVEAVTAVLQDGDFYDPDEMLQGEVVGPLRAFAWPLLVQAAGLARVAGTKLELTPAGRKALGRPAAETLKAAWQRWVATTIIDEFSRVDVIKGQSDRKRMTAVAARREMIETALRDVPPHRWIEVDELFRSMQAKGHRFEVVHDPWKLYISDPHYGSLGYDGFHDWSILQGRFLLALLFEYAATLGLVDVAYVDPRGARDDYGDIWGTDDLVFLSRYDGLRFIRINALGAFALGIAERYQPAQRAPASSARILPNLDVVATAGPFAAGDAALLGVFCVRRADGAFSLDRKAALAAFDKGHRIDELRQFLRRATGGALPDAATAFLDDLGRRAEMLTPIGHALLVECAEEGIAIEIAHHARTRRLCSLAGPRTLVVPAELEATFRRAVLELGFPVGAPRGPR